MGAFTALGVCERLPVERLVLLNAMVPAPGETPGEWWANTGYAFPNDFDEDTLLPPRRPAGGRRRRRRARAP